jgi:hypothetical protein
MSRAAPGEWQAAKTETANDDLFEHTRLMGATGATGATVLKK